MKDFLKCPLGQERHVLNAGSTDTGTQTVGFEFDNINFSTECISYHDRFPLGDDSTDGRWLLMGDGSWVFTGDVSWVKCFYSP